MLERSGRRTNGVASGHRNIVDRHGMWSNFSGRVHAQPSRVSYPRSETELQTLVRDTRENIRAVGTGHSCTPLCATDGLLVCLDDIAGIVAISKDKQTATIRGGSKIHDLGPTLRDAGLATINQGDVDVQSIAGAVSTGTHGTGPRLGSMSTAVRSMRIVLASGDVLECSPDVEPEIFKAARVSLGAFGVISEVELQLVPAYRLHQREWKEGVSGARSFISRSNQNRHLEFFWSPARDVVYLKSLNPTDDEPSDLPDQKRELIGHSADVFPSIREDPFNELEFAVPAAKGVECFQEIRKMMRERHEEVFWPVEVRTLAADDIDLSPAFERDSVTISVHQAADLPSDKLFADAQAVFANYGGRPHWGKFHTLEARELRDLYPNWDNFLKIRSRLDPSGKFTNPYLRVLLGA
jgi:FAD/FMN-containing dehydrogenase